MNEKWRIYRELIITEAQTMSNPKPKVIAKKMGVSKEMVMKVLIAEGLWKSKRSEEINSYIESGKTVGEIAELLAVTESALWAYLPYMGKN